MFLKAIGFGGVANAPHLTLARLRHKPPALPSSEGLNLEAPLDFRASVGSSTENGVFVKALN
jgi:hypothetical protein